MLWGEAATTFSSAATARTSSTAAPTTTRSMAARVTTRSSAATATTRCTAATAPNSFYFHSLSSGRDDIYDFQIGVDKIIIDATAYGFQGMTVQDFIQQYVSSRAATVRSTSAATAMIPARRAARRRQRLRSRGQHRSGLNPVAAPASGRCRLRRTSPSSTFRNSRSVAGFAAGAERGFWRVDAFPYKPGLA